MRRNSMKLISNPVIICLTLCLSFMIIVHEIRSDFRGHLYGKYSDNTAHALTGAKIWYEEGPKNISFAHILSRKSVQYKNFDADVHEAIAKIPAPEENLKGKVVDVVEKGYALNDKVLRYSKVVVGE